MNKIFKIVFIRHGESLGNLENRFTGWLDVDLTEKGYLESYKTGIKLKNLKYKFDICYTSKLKRAIKTAWAVLDGLDLNYIKIKKNINLNERFYGDLLGMNKLEASLKYGREKINNLLNSYKNRPPKLKKNDKRLILIKKKYNKNIIPLTESLSDLLKRIKKFWTKKIIKNIKKKKILIVAHSNILKILMNYIDNKKKNEILRNSKPVVYEFDEKIKKINSYII